MTSHVIRWVCNNKLLVFFGLATFCFLVSTVALSTQNIALKRSITFIKQKTSQQNSGDLPNQAGSVQSYRLSKNVIPTNYALKLNPNLVEKIFEGDVKIALKILKPVKVISLHAKDLKIQGAEVRSSHNQSMAVVSTNLLLASEVFQVNLQEETEANTNYELHLTFTGKLDDGIIGFYASTMRNGELWSLGSVTYKVSTGICRCKSAISFNTMENFVKTKLTERLCSSVRPTHYRLLLSPDLETGLFVGDVTIDVNVNQEKRSLALHSKFLNVDSLKVYRSSTEVSVAKFLEEVSLEQLIIHFDTNLTPGRYHVHIKFNGNLTRNIVGFYLSHLKDKSTMVASKFQPTYARQAFPCFDEPDFKATYDITLVKPLNYVALSNMNEISKTLDPSSNTETVTFATSVPMSTYLACFVICNFEAKENEIMANGIGSNFTLRSFAQKDQLHKIDFAQDIGKRATEFYIKYYEVPFPLPKLDMIAIPDYVSGATEHWGLITYRETSFLIDEETASSRNKISVANTVAHELAHMWFGNLVTMKWWDEVWLNEGFASYMQVKSLNAIEPSWTMLDQFLTRTLHSVLVTDAKLSSHPIVQTVETPDQITAIFDSISYNKVGKCI
ncbi:jg17423 [Pararge aegeria aegeria]|uniref:glutamyl aminopeptidase n=1 Tax=Pararge aegeria aegeria TaxID=348720 RepID=A0A8S4SAN4_9NEOP|nr:jg17423 [Pararge aegeria aegeria]